MNWQPDVLHVNDWPGGLAPAYLRWQGARVPTVLTIHNIAYQGLCDRERMTAARHPGGRVPHQRRRVPRPGVVPQGRAVLRRPRIDRQSDLCARDHHRGVRRRPARPDQRHRRRGAAVRHRQRDRRHLGPAPRSASAAPFRGRRPVRQAGERRTGAHRAVPEALRGAAVRGGVAPGAPEGAGHRRRYRPRHRARGRADRHPGPGRSGHRAHAEPARAQPSRQHRPADRVQRADGAADRRGQRLLPDAVALRAVRADADAGAALRHRCRSRTAPAAWPTRSRTARPGSCSPTCRARGCSAPAAARSRRSTIPACWPRCVRRRWRAASIGRARRRSTSSSMRG